MKKPFKYSTVGKFLTGNVFKSIATKIPFGVGSLVGDLLNKNETEEGTITREKLVHNIVKIVIYCILAVFWLRGDITLDQAEDAKQLITN